MLMCMAPELMPRAAMGCLHGVVITISKMGYTASKVRSVGSVLVRDIGRMVFILLGRVDMVCSYLCKSVFTVPFRDLSINLSAIPQVAQTSFSDYK